MKKKNLIVLLLLPFLIATLCIVTVNITYNAVDVDISAIDWDYKDFEAFKLSDGASYKLKASGVNRNNYKLADGNELVWSVQNKNASEVEPLAQIVNTNGEFYFKPLKEGEVTITCSTQKGNVSRRMTGVIYENSVILLQSEILGSQNNIDSTIYYGQYDLEGTNKKLASIKMNVQTFPSSIIETVSAVCSENISFDLKNQTISILSTGKATLTLESPAANSVSYSFEIVENGVNVYTYEDLLNCTNRSKEGEIVVLRKHFESVDNAYIKSGTSLIKRENNTECFGNYDAKTNSYTFKNEIYSFETTYNSNYVDQWNNFVKSNPQYAEISKMVNVGVYVQKDFYGNGYTLNFHNLTFPYGKAQGSTGQSIPTLTEDNLFRGPISFYTLGDPNGLYLVSALGQDNVGIYVEGENITVNDVVVKNCDYGDRVANLDTVGTVLEVYGKNLTIKNSRISNGKNVIRAFSTTNFILKNCMISNSRNFLVLTGANEYVPVDGSAVKQFVDFNGRSYSSTVNDYLSKGNDGDNAFNNFLVNDYSQNGSERESLKRVIGSAHSALNSSVLVKDNFKGNTIIEDCLFANSGISAIGIESLFNGPFLFNASPTLVTSVFNSDKVSVGKSLIPYVPTQVSGVSYPVKVEIKGLTCFYDYKTKDQIDLSGLISENISVIANTIISGGDYNITIDDIFPLKTMLMQNAYGYTHSSGGSTYVNVPVAYYGGGLNLSKVTFSGENSDYYGRKVDVDLLDTYLNLRGGNGTIDVANMKNIMMKTVTTVIGYEPFGFHFVDDGYLFGETPKDSQLIDNAKGEN